MQAAAPVASCVRSQLPLESGKFAKMLTREFTVPKSVVKVSSPEMEVITPVPKSCGSPSGALGTSEVQVIFMNREF